MRGALIIVLGLSAAVLACAAPARADVSCPPGTYWNGGACIEAQPGGYSPGGSATYETPCAPGSYAVLAGSSSCTTMLVFSLGPALTFDLVLLRRVGYPAIAIVRSTARLDPFDDHAKDSLTRKRADREIYLYLVPRRRAHQRH